MYMTKPVCSHVLAFSACTLKIAHIINLSQVKSWDKRVQTPGMSPPRAGAWTYCLFTP